MYREKIILAYRALIKMHNKLTDRIINVAMLGEFAEVNAVFQVGDAYNFDLEQFRGTNDVNLNLLLKLFDDLEDIMNSLANINGITEEEIDDLRIWLYDGLMVWSLSQFESDHMIYDGMMMGIKIIKLNSEQEWAYRKLIVKFEVRCRQNFLLFERKELFNLKKLSLASSENLDVERKI